MRNSHWEGLQAQGLNSAISLANSHCPLEMRKTVLEASPGQKIAFMETKVEPSFPRFRNAAFVKAESRPSLARLADEQLKENEQWMHVDTECKHKWMIMHENDEW